MKNSIDSSIDSSKNSLRHGLRHGLVNDKSRFVAPLAPTLGNSSKDFFGNLFGVNLRVLFGRNPYRRK